VEARAGGRGSDGSGFRTRRAAPETGRVRRRRRPETGGSLGGRSGRARRGAGEGARRGGSRAARGDGRARGARAREGRVARTVTHEHRARLRRGRRDARRGAGDAHAMAAAKAHLVGRADVRAESRDHAGRDAEDEPRWRGRRRRGGEGTSASASARGGGEGEREPCAERRASRDDARKRHRPLMDRACGRAPIVETRHRFLVDERGEP